MSIIKYCSNQTSIFFPPELSRLPNDPDRSETYMSSREWLDLHGLKAKKLGFYDILSGVAFKHQDGVVDLKVAPCDEYQTDAVRYFIYGI